ncbi:MAG: ATP-binding protein [Candidatus Hydrogenedentes bacterium]|nr:ATP-binding protein [Candidatus Hydrogenedentota bacterium]
MGRAEDLYSRLGSEGYPGIQALIAERRSEELFLDFKRSSNNGSGKSLHDNDRNNLAKAISGFGNSAGGVIVWGIDCSRVQDAADVANCEFPLEDAKRFKSWLEGAVSGCTFPPHTGVVHASIDNGRDSQGFVVTLVPQSMQAPHQVVRGTQYYMRAGSDFVPVPHQVLSGMFGRRPQANLVGNWLCPPARIVANTIQFEVGFVIRNFGLGIARDVFMDVKLLKTGGELCQFSFEVLDNQNWTGACAFTAFMNMISRQDYRMPPGAFAQPLKFSASFVPPFTKPFTLERTDGCEGTSPRPLVLNTEPEILSQTYERVMASHRTRTLSESDLSDVVQEFLGVPMTKK